MIVRPLEDGRLLCCPQPGHGLTAAQFCRHWGNQEFAAPVPYEAVLTAIANHDNGWIPWERAPRLCADGMPMDFLRFDSTPEKAAIWRRGVDCAWGQHPYAAVLIARHAAMLYESALVEYAYSDEDQAVIRDFLAYADQVTERAREVLSSSPELDAALTPAAVAANAHLLRFGDRAALQVAVPWPREQVISMCPVDAQGAFTDIRMCYDETTITFEPWPYGVEHFTVSVEGYLLSQQRFDREEAYHQALAEAPFFRRTWDVVHA